MTALPFRKMHGLGNDFVVIDLRDRPVPLTLPQRRWIADRKRGIGCDQLILLEPPQQKVADIFMRIHNADGGEVGACGNATRCIAAKVMAEKASRHVIIETIAGLLDAEAAEGGRVAVDMGLVRLDWREIPLSEACDTLHLPLSLGPLSDPVGVNVGNPHAVFFVSDVERIDLATFGPMLERNRLFPQRANIEVAQILSPERVRMRIWERGVGITQASGSGSCATLVAAARRKLTGRSATVVLDGGELLIEWLADDHVRMTGDWAESFHGEIDIAELERAVA
jgi:diaminopimelate epimerase